VRKERRERARDRAEAAKPDEADAIDVVFDELGG
jgi:hypothetical protein